MEQVKETDHLIVKIFNASRELGWSLSYENDKEKVDGLVIGTKDFLTRILQPVKENKLYTKLREEAKRILKERPKILEGNDDVTKTYEDLKALLDIIVYGDDTFNLDKDD